MDDNPLYRDASARLRDMLAEKTRKHPKPSRLVLSKLKGSSRRIADADVVVVQGVVVKDRYGVVGRRG